MAKMRDALVVALEAVAESLIQAGHRQDVADLLDALLEVAKGRGLELGDEHLTAVIPFIDRSTDPLGQSVDQN